MVTPIQPDGILGFEMKVGSGADVAAEFENTRMMARLRMLADDMRVYDPVLRSDGSFHEYGGLERRPEDPRRSESRITEVNKRRGEQGGDARAPAVIDPARRKALAAFWEAADDAGLVRNARH